MSIKGDGQELYVGKKESNIINYFGTKTKIIYDDLIRIDYCYFSKGDGGYLDFVKSSGRPIRFRFYKNANEKIERTIDLIRENNFDLDIIEHKVSDMKFYQRTWFIVLMMFFCCMPLGLFLMWYYKKYSKPVMAMFTVVFISLWGAGVYMEYLSYTATMNEISHTVDSLYGNNFNGEELEDNSILTTEASTEAYPYSTVYESGTYKVGNDIPAGEYVVFNTGNDTSYFQISRDSSGTIDSIAANGNFSYNTIITVDSGQYLTLSFSYAVPITEVDTLDTTQAGMFKVGTHLDAGEYMIQATSDYSYIEVASDSKHLIPGSIITNNVFDSFTYITVEDGQYLTLSNCYINTDN